MKKYITGACVLLMILSLLAVGCAQGKKEPATDLEKVSEFEGGRLYRADRIFVCQLYGSYEEMGRQYGGLMKSQIRQFHDEAMNEIEKHTELPKEEFKSIPAKLYERYPARIKAVFAGMEKTSGLDLAELKFCDCVETVAMAYELEQQPVWLQEFVAFSRLRSDNLTALAEADKGRINANTMKKIMDTTTGEGGAIHADTIYQFVAEPSEREVWVKAPGFQDWTLINYGKLFD